MKALNKIWAAGLLAIAMMLFMPRDTKAQYGEISFQAFYDDLAPYGTWVDDPDYGDVWVPDAGADFRPYGTNGHWAVTSYGNTWVSDYEWGWAPFHYGRWRFDDYYGWEWIPDYEWGPAWVSWRTGGDYYGWAPMGPGINIDVAIGGYSVPDIYWVFAPRAYITSPYIYNYYVPRPRVVNIIHNTTIINNVYVNNSRRYVSGPPVRDMQRYTRTRINVYSINNESRPGASHVRNNTVNIYRPAVRHDEQARPQRVVDARAYRNANPSQRITNNHQNAQRLANYARTATPDNKVVRENRHPANPVANTTTNNNNRPVVNPTPADQNVGRKPRTNVPRTDRQPTPVNRPGQPVQHDRTVTHDQHNQQQDAQRQQADRQQRDQQRNQQMEQQRQQQAQQRQQQDAQRQQADRQQRDQQRNQQMEQQRQQQAQQRQQQDAQRQQAERQQRDQQRNQQMEQQRQQQAQQRQQQDAQRQQAERQQRDQQRNQQMEQQRQQQAQQRQQQDAQRQQAERQQRDQQRQQQMEQQRQQQQQQQPQQQPQQQHGRGRGPRG